MEMNRFLRCLYVAFLLSIDINIFADDIQIDGIYYNLIEKDKVAEVVSHPDNYSGNVVIPSSVSYGGIHYSVISIGRNAFLNCSSLKSVSIPSSVTSIGNGAFYHCSSLTFVNIPSSVTSIGNGAFQGCI